MRYRRSWTLCALGKYTPGCLSDARPCPHLASNASLRGARSAPDRQRRETESVVFNQKPKRATADGRYSSRILLPPYLAADVRVRSGCTLDQPRRSTQERLLLHVLLRRHLLPSHLLLSHLLLSHLLSHLLLDRRSPTPRLLSQRRRQTNQDHVTIVCPCRSHRTRCRQLPLRRRGRKEAPKSLPHG